MHKAGATLTKRRKEKSNAFSYYRMCFCTIECVPLTIERKRRRMNARNGVIPEKMPETPDKQNNPRRKTIPKKIIPGKKTHIYTFSLIP